METLRLDRIYFETFFISVELLHKSYSLFFFLLEFNYRAKGGPSLKEEEG